jgi:DNA-binding NarL/FixJ family response regulator
VSTFLGGADDRLTRWSPDADDRELLRLLAQGLTTEAVARKKCISERTVRRRLRSLADELGVDSTIQVVVRAVRDNLI